jgi:hypothetical protein
MTPGRAAEAFGLGRLVAEPAAVAGGLSNELWRVATDRGVFAVKRMVANAERPGFVANVEAAFRIERAAWTAGVPMPEPLAHPATGRALARVDGALFRVHRWVDGEAGAGSPAEAAALLARIHVAGAPRTELLPGRTATRWFRELPPPSAPVVVVDSHGDLDRKNTLRSGGVLLALDWDAAGPVSAVQEAVALALDWSGSFTSTIEAYERVSGMVVPAEPWVFGGWVAAQSGWLEHNLAQPAGAAEAATTLARLREVDADLGVLVASLAR